MNINLEDYIKKYKDKVNYYLREYFNELKKEINSNFTSTKILLDSMEYSLSIGGKRLRPILALASTELVNGDINNTLPSACALELIHTQSLIHDDLPCMDNDDFRRGHLSNHKVYGEAIALLAGDALLTQSFDLIVSKTPSTVPALVILKVIKEITEAIGIKGICGGQAADIITNIDQNPNIELLNYIHSHKTASFIKCALRVGIILGNGNEQQLEAISKYGEYLGISFQIIDDILDIIGEKDKLGKSIGKDQKLKKLTYPYIYGIPKSKEIAKNYIELAIKELEIFKGNTEFFKLLAISILEREK